MYVCICKAVTEREILRELEDGARSLKDINRRLGVGTQCGSCCAHAKQIVQAYKNQPAYDLAYAAS